MHYVIYQWYHDDSDSWSLDFMSFLGLKSANRFISLIKTNKNYRDIIGPLKNS